MKTILIVLCIIGVAVSENYNWIGYGDTTILKSFKADSLKYGKTRLLGTYANMRVDVWANDTSSAGYASDSIAFMWGVQVGHPFKNSSGTLCTLWSKQKLLVDTFMLSSGIVTDTFVVQGLNGTYNMLRNVIDTSRTDFMRQTDGVIPEWDVFVRTWYKGIAGNEKGSMLSIRDMVYRRLKTE